MTIEIPLPKTAKLYYETCAKINQHNHKAIWSKFEEENWYIGLDQARNHFHLWHDACLAYTGCSFAHNERAWNLEQICPQAGRWIDLQLIQMHYKNTVHKTTTSLSMRHLSREDVQMWSILLQPRDLSWGSSWLIDKPIKAPPRLFNSVPLARTTWLCGNCGVPFCTTARKPQCINMHCHACMPLTHVLCLLHLLPIFLQPRDSYCLSYPNQETKLRKQLADR